MYLNENTGNRLRKLVDDIIDQWREGQPPDALSAIQKHPELQQHHSLAVDLAYEEYCLREESGEAPDAEEFCNRFSRFRYSLSRMLNLHGVLRSKALGLPAEEAIPWPKVAEQWLDWELVEEIGRGAFSRVFLARETAIGNRLVVVKCSRAGPSEAFVLGKLSHPNVMPIHSARHDQVRGLIGICMPFVGRRTLGHVLDRLNQDDCDATAELFDSAATAQQKDTSGVKEPSGASYSLAVARIVGQVAQGLAAAHQVNVLHGDLKPSNIILGFTGEPLLVDFNLAEDGEAAERLGGTPPYMAPERLALLSLPGLSQDRARDSGLGSDVFSLGVVLHELLFGEAPFEFEIEELEAGYRHTNLAAIETRRDLADEYVPRELCEIIESAITLDPAARCPSAQVFADRIAQFIARMSLPEPQTSAATITRQFTTYLIAVSLLLTVAAAWAIAAVEFSPVQQTLRNIQANDYLRASERLEAANQSNPSPALEAWLGYCFVKMRKFERARYHLTRAKPDEDSTGILWHNIGCCHAHIGQTGVAIDCFSRALDRNPYLGKAYQERAKAKTREAMKRQMQPIDGTFEDIVAAISLEHDGPYLYGEAALIYWFGLQTNVDVRSEAENSVRKALQLGIPPTALTKVFPPDFEFERLIPEPLPIEAPPHDSTSSFIRPPYDLVKIWPTKTSAE